jgi:hypothetical protein
MPLVIPRSHVHLVRHILLPAGEVLECYQRHGDALRIVTEVQGKGTIRKGEP